MYQGKGCARTGTRVTWYHKVPVFQPVSSRRVRPRTVPRTLSAQSKPSQLAYQFMSPVSVCNASGSFAALLLLGSPADVLQALLARAIAASVAAAPRTCNCLGSPVDTSSSTQGQRIFSPKILLQVHHQVVRCERQGGRRAPPPPCRVRSLPS